MVGSIEIKNKTKGERVVKALLKKQTKAKVDAEVGVLGAMDLIEKLQKEQAALKEEVATLLGQYRLIWKWKGEMERREAGR